MGPRRSEKERGGSLLGNWGCFWDYELLFDLKIYVCFIIDHATKLICLMCICIYVIFYN